MPETTTFRVGDTVRFQFGVQKVDGTVKEDRGPIGVKGRRLYLIRFTREGAGEAHVELPAEEMERVPGNAKIG